MSPLTSVTPLSLRIDLEVSGEDTATPWAFRDDKDTLAYLPWLTGLQAPFAVHALCWCPGAGSGGAAGWPL